jgi:BA14K-like protein
MLSSQPGQAKPFLFYCAVLLVAGSSVVLGLDWTVAPLPPMHETEASVQAAKLAAHLPPPVVRTVKAVTQPGPMQPAQPAGRGPRVAAVNPAAKPVRNGTATPAIMAPEQTATQTAAESEQPKCDIDACAAAYRSFRASDCSWQPYEGPRRFCDKGQPPQDVVTTADAGAATDAGQQVSDKCDIAACRQAYFTFTPSDCTYQPSNGPRRLCTKGTPPPAAPEAAIDPAVAAANAANAAAKAEQAKQDQAKPAQANADQAQADAAKSDQAKPKCNIEACKQAYFTFTPEDCTYQPSDGPRRICTK